jgi:ABC-type multidrug transport system fused ATPase/permease subunit
MALLLRLYDPEEGRITIDGRDLRRYRVQSVRDQMAVVLQEPILFGGTIRENIEFGKLGATSDEVEQAARLANAHDFIEKFPDGYDSKVAEMGANLSGGQRQRITIARAFIRDAPILLLDEPTFGLDASAEAEVTEALERLMRGRTTIVVAHRLASLGNADRILVMKRGRIRECGTHDELVEADDWYSRNWKMQVEKNRPAAAGARTGQP